MPNNCSTLIQRKQNILHKILRSNSDGKLQNGEKKKFIQPSFFRI
jgi:hypothetical protein